MVKSGERDVAVKMDCDSCSKKECRYKKIAVDLKKAAVDQNGLIVKLKT
jgi:hypothetical protein